MNSPDRLDDPYFLLSKFGVIGSDSNPSPDPTVLTPDMTSPWAEPASLWVDYFKHSNCGHRLFMSYTERETRINHVGYPILTQETLSALVQLCQNRTVLDVGARTGFMTRNLLKFGIDCLGIDLFETVIDDQRIVEAGDFRDYDRDIVLLSWPPYLEDLAYQVAATMKSGKTLVYQGEGRGGCTGDDQFFDELNLNFVLDKTATNSLNAHHVTWPGLHDLWYVYVKQ